MAKRTQVTLIDDIDGGEAQQTINFTFKGISYEIDLSDANVAALDAALDPYVKAARKATRGSASRTRSASAKSRDVRAWAIANDIHVPARGRIPTRVTEQYDAAH